MVRAVLFDLDDTLVDRAAAFGRWIDTLLARFPHVSRVRLIDLDGRGHTDRTTFARAAIRELGVPLDAAALRDEIQSHIVAHIEAMPGASELLASLAQKMTVGVVTNGGSVTQRAKLDRAGLATYAPTAIISEEIGVAKPAPAIFVRALERAGCSPAEAWFVGDDPERDIAGAAAVGMRTAWLQDGRTWPEKLQPPDRVLGNLGELVSCFE